MKHTEGSARSQQVVSHRGADDDSSGNHGNSGADTVFSRQELDTLAETLVRSRMKLGLAAADAAWVDRLFDDWLIGLRSTTHVLHRVSASRLAVGMTRSLAIRDSLIISMVSTIEGDHPVATDKKALIEMASRPHAPHSVQRMSHLLAQTFEDEHMHADPHRCSQGVRMLLQLIALIPKQYAVQLHAVVAYVCWWMGDERAADHARIALEFDERCTLAAIVSSALRHHIAPAWNRRSSEGAQAAS